MIVGKSIIIKNIFWKFAERCSSQAVSFMVSIVLARLLMPSDYGTIALCLVFITILQVFEDSGLGTALVQRKDVDQVDFSSIFYFNVFSSFILYIIIYFIAPYIEVFFRISGLTSLIRFLGLTLIINAFRNIQQSYVAKMLLFKKVFFANFYASIISACLGLLLAYNNFGVWALVWQQLSNSFLITVVLWIIVPWRPSVMFSLKRFNILYKYGWKLLLSSLLDTAYNQFAQLVIGRFFSAAELGAFNQGQKFPNFIINNINATIDSVLLPTLSLQQDNIDKVRTSTRRAIKMSIFFIAPIMMILAAASNNIVILILTDKWLSCVPFFVVFCFNYMFYPIHTANLSAINALGRSDIFLKLEIQKKIVGVSILLYALQYGAFAIAIGMLIECLIGQIINTRPNFKLLGYGYLQQLKDITPSVFAAIFSGGGTFFIGYLPYSPIVLVLLQVVFGSCMYVITSYVIRNEMLFYTINSIKYRITVK